MASIKEAFGEYKPNKSKVYFDAPVSLGELLDRLAAGGVPMAHTLSEFHKNPEAPATEFVQNATDEVVPFKYQLRTGQATPESMAKEAVMLAAPMPVKGRYVMEPISTKAFNKKLMSTLPDDVKYLADERPWTIEDIFTADAYGVDVPENTMIRQKGYDGTWEHTDYKDLVKRQADEIEGYGKETIEDLGTGRISLDEALEDFADKNLDPLNNMAGNYDGIKPDMDNITVKDIKNINKDVLEELASRGYDIDALNALLSNGEIDYATLQNLKNKQINNLFDELD